MNNRLPASMLMLGDSLIEWGEWDTLLPGVSVRNQGRAGETVEELAARLGEELVRAGSPDAVLIMSGTNNLLLGDRLFPFVLESILQRVAAFFPDTMILLNSMFPVSPTWVPLDTVIDVNADLAEIAKRNQAGFLDMLPVFATSCDPGETPCLLPDGIHLTEHGYRVWAAAIRTCLAAG